MRESVAALSAFVEQNPSLSPVLQGHLVGYGELIPTLFMAEIIDWMVDHREDDPDVVTAVITWMNETYPTAAEELKNVIATGGVEAMPAPGEPGSVLRQRLSSELRATDPWPSS